MTGMVVDAGHALDHQRHPRQRPEIRLKAVRPRTFPQRLLHLLKLPGIEPRFAACPAGAAKGADAATPPLDVPPAHTLPAHLQLASDRGQDQLAGSKQTAGLFAAVFELLKIAAGTNMCGHASSIHEHANCVTVLCEIQ